MGKELTIKDRLILLSALPQENDVTTLKIIRQTQDMLGINEEEHKEVELKVEGSNYTFNQEKDIPKNFDIGEKATDIIIEALKSLNKKKKIRMEMLETYDKFIETNKQ